MMVTVTEAGRGLRDRLPVAYSRTATVAAGTRPGASAIWCPRLRVRYTAQEEATWIRRRVALGRS
jgi:hypothetical protein